MTVPWLRLYSPQRRPPFEAQDRPRLGLDEANARLKLSSTARRSFLVGLIGFAPSVKAGEE